MVRERILIIEHEVYPENSSFTLLSAYPYQAESVSSVFQALEKLDQQPFDLILTDLSLPNIDGLQFLHRLQKAYPDIPSVVMVSSGNLVEAILSMKLGAQGFIIKPFSSKELFQAVETVLQKNRGLRTREERKWLQTLEEAQRDTVKALAQAIGVKDHYTGDHCDRMVEYAEAIGERFGLTVQERKILIYAAALHDIGKIGIPERILSKPGKLTPEEFGVMKTHPEKGAAIIQGIGFLAPVAPLIYHHQERYDGQGYPDGLAGEEIPLGSRIVAVLDTFDAMTSDRPYRKALSIEKAIAELQRFSRQQFDPVVVEVFMQVFQEQSPDIHQIFDIDISAHPLQRPIQP